MRLDTGNRSFAILLGLSAVLYVGLGTAACALLSLLVYRLASDGPSAFGEHAWAVIPAGLFLSVNAFGLILGVRSLGQQLASSRQLRRRVARLSRRPSDQLAAQAREAGLGRRVRVIDSSEPFSFAYGAWRPRVVVSQGLLDCASEDEVRAVLVHERYHVRNLDPLKVVLARAASATFLLLPAMRALERRYLAGRELAADRRAMAACGRNPLAGALLKVVRGPAWPELSSAAAIGGPELLDQRVAQLESGREPPFQLTPGAILVTVAVLVLCAASFVTAVLGLHGVGAVLGMPADSASGAGGLVMSLGCLAPLGIAGWLAWRWHTA